MNKAFLTNPDKQVLAGAIIAKKGFMMTELKKERARCAGNENKSK